MKKTHKVLLLNTEGISNIGIPLDDLQYDKDGFDPHIIQNKHLHILSDDEIKEGDWCMLLDSFGTPMFGEPQQYLATKGQVLNDGLRKVIATTDKSLLFTEEKDKDFRGSEYERKITLPQLPESFIKAYIKAYNEGNPITEVDLEMVFTEAKAIDDTLEGMDYANPELGYQIKTRPDNTVIIHQSRMYSRDEIIKLLELYEPDAPNKRNKFINENL